METARCLDSIPLQVRECAHPYSARKMAAFVALQHEKMSNPSARQLILLTCQ